MSEYGIATSGNPVRHRCETSAYRDLGVTDKIMPLDSKDPWLTLHVKGFDNFHVQSSDMKVLSHGVVSIGCR